MGNKQRQSNKRRKVEADGFKATAVESEKYAEQLAAKVANVKQLFQDLSPPELEIFESQKEHYRLRAEFRVWQSADDIFYIMFEKAGDDTSKSKDREWDRRRIDSFPVASVTINVLMKALLEHIKEERVLRQKLFQANFHCTLTGEAMVSLLYHRQLDDSWTEAAEKLRSAMSSAVSAEGGKVSLIGRSKNKKLVLGEDFILENMQVDNRTFVYKQVEGGFSQPNGGMCRKMLEWARAVTRGSTDGDLLELYCGNGNFTIALAENFREVIATEVTKASVAAAKYNLEVNGISNVSIARLSSEEFTQAWRGEREFFRMKDMPAVKDRSFKTLLVDPPRAGLDEKTVELLQHFDNIVYISCNPQTLHANLLQIADSHHIKQFALFDQFPYTSHIECGVYLTRKTEALP